MTGGLPKNPWLMLVAGLSLGLLVGVSMVAGVLIGTVHPPEGGAR